ncbi:MFS transporter [Streptomyces sp. NPDC098781]|uniref:MFS transporter n=1 Tax=Streptomyces sp. NPDC098781 TaxID=3366097 RepID=UPI00382AC73A
MFRAAPGALASRIRLTRRSSFALDASILVALLAASSAPTPLYAIYQAQWHFSALALTVVFSAYAVAMLLALLTTGSLSDHLGRRPVLLAALIAEAVVMVVLATADGVGQLIAARVLQGLATGAATSAVGAALLELEHPDRSGKAALTNSVAPVAGMAAGVLGATLLVSFAPAPTVTVHLALLAVFVLQALALVLTPETAPRRPGALRSLRPAVKVPASARRAMLLAAPSVVAVWALGGFASSLGPGLARLIDSSVLPAVSGLVFFALTVSAVLSVWGMGRFRAHVMVATGAGAVIPGVALMVLSIQIDSLTALFAGSAVAGVGFGAVSQGVLRTILPRVTPQDRSGVLAAYYVISYLAMSVPAVLAGLLTVRYGLLTASVLFGGAVAALGVAALVAALAPGARTSCVPHRRSAVVATGGPSAAPSTCPPLPSLPSPRA